MHNPNVSAEAKEHSRQVVEEIEGSGVVQDEGTTTTEPSSRPNYGGDKEENRVLGGVQGNPEKSVFLLLTGEIVDC